MRNAKLKPKKFIPVFAPSYVEVVAIHKDSGREMLQIKAIEYSGNEIRVYVNLRH